MSSWTFELSVVYPTTSLLLLVVFHISHGPVVKRSSSSNISTIHTRFKDTILRYLRTIQDADLL